MVEVYHFAPQLISMYFCWTNHLRYLCCFQETIAASSQVHKKVHRRLLFALLWTGFAAIKTLSSAVYLCSSHGGVILPRQNISLYPFLRCRSGKNQYCIMLMNSTTRHGKLEAGNKNPKKNVKKFKTVMSPGFALGGRE